MKMALGRKRKIAAVVVPAVALAVLLASAQARENALAQERAQLRGAMRLGARLTNSTSLGAPNMPAVSHVG